LVYLDSNRSTYIQLILKEERFNPNIFRPFKKYSEIRGFHLEIKEKRVSHISANNYQVCDFQSITKLNIFNENSTRTTIFNQYLSKINQAQILKLI
jgi:hypothetical protein